METTLFTIRYLSQTSRSAISICRDCQTPLPFRAQLLRHKVMRGQRISREQRGFYGIDLKALDARHAGEKLLPALWTSSRLTFTQAPAERGLWLLPETLHQLGSAPRPFQGPHNPLQCGGEVIRCPENRGLRSQPVRHRSGGVRKGDPGVGERVLPLDHSPCPSL